MNDNSSILHVFSGTEITVNHLKNILEENNVPSLIKNDYAAGQSAGFMGGTPFAIDLYIQEVDKDKAEPIIEKFKATIQD
ncbi:putative signal transducing protein [Carboxylicivirga sp. N1Y90]|uniref:putative signal transducing protein n=1 Tax=Carboxylicivirga fragile TaxID=3417571 RepID=UPI003D33A7D0|nr:DUF2007 domain-containing protein [Marinilabiliaceae bacterium N1Y90]